MVKLIKKFSNYSKRGLTFHCLLRCSYFEKYNAYVVLMTTKMSTKGVYIYHNDCLWCVDDNEGLYHPFDFGANGQGQICLKYVYSLFIF